MKKLLQKVLVVTLSLMMILSFAGLASAGEGEAEYKLIFSTGDAESNVMCEVWRAWADKVNEVTNGQVEIEIHYNGELAATGVALTAVQMGQVDIAFVATTIDAAFQLDVLSEAIPYTNKCQHLSRVYTACMEYPDFAKEWEGYKVLALLGQPDEVIANTKKEIKSAADVSGMTLGVCSALQANTLAKMGASGVFCEPNGEYTAMEKGVVDGCIYLPWDSMLTQSWAELTDYAIMMPACTSRNGIIMNEYAWESLPQDCRDAIDGLQDWFVDLFDETLVKRNIECMEACEKDYGVQFYWPTEEEVAGFQAVRDEAVAEYIADLDSKGIDATGFWAFYTELLEENSTDPYVDFDFSGPIW